MVSGEFMLGVRNPLGVAAGRGGGVTGGGVTGGGVTGGGVPGGGVPEITPFNLSIKSDNELELSGAVVESIPGVVDDLPVEPNGSNGLFAALGSAHSEAPPHCVMLLLGANGSRYEDFPL